MFSAALGRKESRKLERFLEMCQLTPDRLDPGDASSRCRQSFQFEKHLKLYNYIVIPFHHWTHFLYGSGQTPNGDDKMDYENQILISVSPE